MRIISYIIVSIIFISSSIFAQKSDVPFEDIFEDAMLDAQNPEPHEIYKGLTVIEGNKNLIDTLINGERYILAVSWKGHESWYADAGQLDSTQSYPLWVTIAPQIKLKCEEYFATLSDPNMRLRQLLGLQPITDEVFFLEVWVKPGDLWRPCPDNETDDSECGLALPESVSSDYREWFNDTRATQYVDCTDSSYADVGFPWTQLGYTYDWNPKNTTHVGLSEFVVPADKYFYVRGKYLTEDYCDFGRTK